MGPQRDRLLRHDEREIGAQQALEALEAQELVAHERRGTVWSAA
ncbi:hypothetical protein [Lentzea albidocapillata]|nr:hypothetical protein [Lentzea albidocapillata]